MDYEQIAKRAKYYALSKGSKNEDAEDFASYCLELSITRPYRKHFKWMYIDFYRELTGWKRKSRFETPPETTVEMKLPLQLPAGLSVREREVLRLYCTWGFTKKEIANCLGVSYVTIWTLFKRLKRFNRNS